MGSVGATPTRQITKAKMEPNTEEQSDDHRLGPWCNSSMTGSSPVGEGANPSGPVNIVDERLVSPSNSGFGAVSDSNLGNRHRCLTIQIHAPLGKQQSRRLEGSEFPGANPGGSIIPAY